jgi:hypothetical protein
MKEKLNMNAKMLLLGTIVITLAGTTFATDALLTPRAQGNQIKVVVSTPTSAVAVDYVRSTPVAPRYQADQIKVVKGIMSDRNPALECRQNMMGTPRAVTACSQSVTMPGCMKLASSK